MRSVETESKPKDESILKESVNGFRDIDPEKAKQYLESKLIDLENSKVQPSILSSDYYAEEGDQPEKGSQSNPTEPTQFFDS